MEFKRADFEKEMIEKGGNRIKLPCEAQWCSYRDAYKFLIEYEQLLKQIAVDKNVNSNVVKLLYDTQFVDDVKRNLLLLDPICNLIKKCQSNNCSAAEAVELWLDLHLPKEVSEQLKSRRELALNKFALTAFHLHPFLNNSKLGDEHNNIIFEFLFTSLNGAGLEEWDSFKKKSGFFKRLYEKEIKSPLVFWSLAEMKYPNLSKIAIKLLQIPASSAQISCVFSNAEYRPAFKTSKTMLYVYYSLRIKDVAEEEEIELNI